jgi:hypothetical protein
MTTNEALKWAGLPAMKQVKLVEEAERDPWPAGSPKFDSREKWLKAAQSFGAKVTIRKIHDLEQAVVGDPGDRHKSASLGEWNGTVGRLFPADECKKRAERYGHMNETEGTK